MNMGGYISNTKPQQVQQAIAEARRRAFRPSRLISLLSFHDAHLPNPAAFQPLLFHFFLFNIMQKALIRYEIPTLRIGTFLLASNIIGPQLPN